MKENSRKRRIYIIILMTVGIVASLILYAFISLGGMAIPCVFYKITGLFCPGCGNTRAALALLRLDFAAMIHYNCFFIPEILYVGMVYIVSALNYIKNGKFSYRSPCKIIDWIFLVILILWAVIRNVFSVFAL